MTWDDQIQQAHELIGDCLGGKINDHTVPGSIDGSAKLIAKVLAAGIVLVVRAIDGARKK